MTKNYQPQLAPARYQLKKCEGSMIIMPRYDTGSGRSKEQEVRKV